MPDGRSQLRCFHMISEYLACAQKLTGSQLSLYRATSKLKIRPNEENKMKQKLNEHKRGLTLLEKNEEHVIWLSVGLYVKLQIQTG